MKILKFKNPINFIFFQAGWFACALGASSGSNWVGPLVVFLLIATQFYLFKIEKVVLAFIVLIGIFGSLADSILLYFGFFNFQLEPVLPWSYPIWMSALWFNFAICMFISLSWLDRRYILSSLFGFIGGPLSYIAGESFGAISIGEQLLNSALVIGVFWGLITPLIFFLKNQIGLKNVD